MTQEEECHVPAGAEYTTKGIDETANNKRPHTLGDLEGDDDVWQLVPWDGQ